MNEDNQAAGKDTDRWLVIQLYRGCEQHEWRRRRAGRGQPCPRRRWAGLFGDGGNGGNAGVGTPAGNVGAGGTGGLLLGQDGMTGLT